MKILIVMAGFFPGKKYGGPPVSIDNFCSLMQGYQCYIVTRNHDIDSTEPYSNIKNGWNDRKNCKILYLNDKEYNENTFATVVKEIHPDMLYLQGLFQGCILPCLKIAKKYNLRVLLAPRGELCQGAFRKKYKKIPYIGFLRILGLLNNVSFQSTSDEETKAIQKYLGVEESRIHFLTNIPSVPSEAFVREKKKSGEAKFIFLSRIVPKKNLLFAIQCLKEVHGKVQYDIYGPIEDENYWNECKKEIDNLPENIKVNYCGLVEHEDVHRTFSQYDAFLFPTQSENFGHVIAESLMVGTTVLISDQTPWNDVKEHCAGWALPLDQKVRFSQAIESICVLTNEESISLHDDVLRYMKVKMKMGELRDAYSSVLN